MKKRTEWRKMHTKIKCVLYMQIEIIVHIACINNFFVKKCFSLVFIHFAIFRHVYRRHIHKPFLSLSLVSRNPFLLVHILTLFFFCCYVSALKMSKIFAFRSFALLLVSAHCADNNITANLPKGTRAIEHVSVYVCKYI